MSSSRISPVKHLIGSLKLSSYDDVYMIYVKEEQKSKSEWFFNFLIAGNIYIERDIKNCNW